MYLLELLMLIKVRARIKQCHQGPAPPHLPQCLQISYLNRCHPEEGGPVCFPVTSVEERGVKNSSFSRLNICIKLHWLSLHSQGMRNTDWPKKKKKNQGPSPDLGEFSQCQKNHIWMSYFYQKKNEWMLSCKNNIYPVQSTPFNYSIPTLTCIPINIPSKVPTLYINIISLFSQKR